MIELIIQGFHLFVYQPLLKFLIFIYKILPVQDFGLAVILFTILIRLLLLPSTLHSLRAQKKLAELQPEIEKIQKKYQNNKEQQAQELFKLYRKQKINPLSGILSLLIQVPILIGLYRVFLNGFQDFDYLFLNRFDLSQPSLILAFITGITQYFQGKYTIAGTKEKPLSGKNTDFQKILKKQIVYFLPFFTFLILLKLPSVLALYFLTSNIFTIFQQYFILKKEMV